MQNVIQHPQVAPMVPEPQTTPIMPAATSIPQTASPEGRCREVHRVAGELFQRSPDWVTFFREVLGVEGADSLFASDDHRRIQSGLRTRASSHSAV